MSKPMWLEGLANEDCILSRETRVELCRDGVAWTHPNGERGFAPTSGNPEPGGKVTALASLAPLLKQPLVSAVIHGGGALGAAGQLAKLLRDGSTPGRPQVVLLNSGPSSPALEEWAGRTGVLCRSLGRVPTPRNVIIPLANDRLILKEQPAPCPADLDDAHLRTLGSEIAGAEMLASVSSKDPALATVAAAMGNGARRYHQPPGSLAPGLNLLLLSLAHEAVCNLHEWSQVARWAGVEVPEVPEDSPEAANTAAHLLQELRRGQWAGRDGAVATLGRAGCVVMDWLLERAYHVAIDITEGCAPATPASAGDKWLGAYIFYRETWSAQGHLRDPLAATAVRATHAVAGCLGLRRDRYDVRVRRL